MKNGMIMIIDNDYTDMNKLLLGKDNLLSYPNRKRTYEQYFQDLDAALLKYPLSENIVVYRGDKPKHYTILKVGGTYTIAWYQSATILKCKAWSHKGMTITIRVPVGTPGAYIYGHGSHPHEEEYLLGRGLQYKVLKKNATTMELEV
ncbi:hypothetical protein Holit_03056 [Hollandina sp. SP2]